MALLLKNLLFTFVVPGTVGVYVPLWIAAGAGASPDALGLVGGALLALGETHVHEHQHREHHQRDQRRPLEQEANHDEHEADVLGMAHTRVRSRTRKGVGTLCGVEDLPRGGEDPEAGDDECEADPASHHAQVPLRLCARL